jgi:hypothetical protein
VNIRAAGNLAFAVPAPDTGLPGETFLKIAAIAVSQMLRQRRKAMCATVGQFAASSGMVQRSVEHGGIVAGSHTRSVD